MGKKYHFPPKNPEVAEDGDLESGLLLGPERVSFQPPNLHHCATALNAEQPMTPLSPFLSLSRWSWQEAASLTMSTLGTTWRWQSSWAWSSRRGGASSHRAPPRTQPARPLPPLSQRPLSQVGIGFQCVCSWRLVGRTFAELSVPEVPVWRDYK